MGTGWTGTLFGAQVVQGPQEVSPAAGPGLLPRERGSLADM